jgi:transcriptional regulator with GAF, ATPase, and Fis domain
MFSKEEERFARDIDALCYVNPFTSERLELERSALGACFVEEPDAWALGPGHQNRNVALLVERIHSLLSRARPHLESDPAQEHLRGYAGLVRYALYFEFTEALAGLSSAALSPGFGKRRIAVYRELSARVHEHVRNEQLEQKMFGSLEHLFATMFQIRRAFEHIFETIVGRSEPAQALRAAVWQSVFTHDMRRYERSLYRRMHDTNTLILGPSGTGKELVARAIGLSRYLPFDKRSLHFDDFATDAFFALNVGALTPTLVESELFGHRRGSFTGAVADRIGWFESCPEHGTVFLDEIGELEPGVQVKLLRVLQTREFQRVGEQETRRFRGKVITATNQDLHARMQEGAFREDFYYRLCADVIETPPLSAQLASEPEDLERLIAHVARRIVEAGEVNSLVTEVATFVRRELGVDYTWPGNVRELEQCVRNIVVRGRYTPSGSGIGAPIACGEVVESPTLRRIAGEFLRAEGDIERQLDVYVTLSYARTGNYAATGRALGLDRRTVKARIDSQLLAQLREESSGLPNGASDGAGEQDPEIIS